MPTFPEVAHSRLTTTKTDCQLCMQDTRSYTRRSKSLTTTKARRSAQNKNILPLKPASRQAGLGRSLWLCPEHRCWRGVFNATNAACVPSSDSRRRRIRSHTGKHRFQCRLWPGHMLKTGTSCFAFAFIPESGLSNAACVPGRSLVTIGWESALPLFARVTPKWCLVLRQGERKVSETAAFHPGS